MGRPAHRACVLSFVPGEECGHPPKAGGEYMDGRRSAARALKVAVSVDSLAVNREISLDT